MNIAYCLRKLNAENLCEMLGYSFYGEFSIERLLNIDIMQELGLEYAIIYNYDSVLSNKISEIQIDVENIMEARFFNSTSEIRIFNDEGQFSGTVFVENENATSIILDYLLYPRYGEKSGYAKKLQVKKYIDYDENKQAYVSYVKPSSLIF